MKVLSLFDGCSCALQALKNLNVKVKKYYASEIDKYCIKVAKHNHPEIIHIGDITKVDGTKYRGIDLLVGGFSCQSFSRGGNQKGFKDPRGQLFYEYSRILKESKPKYFLAENVRMKDEYKDVISKELGVMPVEIDSALVSAQTRKRLYWANFSIKQPQDAGIDFGHIRLYKVWDDDSIYFNRKNMDYIQRTESGSNRKLKIFKNVGKFNTLVTSMSKGIGTFRLWGINDYPPNKSTTYALRWIHPIECERLQGLPDNYTDCVSKTQRYRMLGNAFNVPTIEHIFKEIV